MTDGLNQVFRQAGGTGSAVVLGGSTNPIDTLMAQQINEQKRRQRIDDKIMDDLTDLDAIGWTVDDQYLDSELEGIRDSYMDYYDQYGRNIPREEQMKLETRMSDYRRIVARSKADEKWFNELIKNKPDDVSEESWNKLLDWGKLPIHQRMFAEKPRLEKEAVGAPLSFYADIDIGARVDRDATLTGTTERHVYDKQTLQGLVDQASETAYGLAHPNYNDAGVLTTNGTAKDFDAAEKLSQLILKRPAMRALDTTSEKYQQTWIEEANKLGMTDVINRMEGLNETAKALPKDERKRQLRVDRNKAQFNGYTFTWTGAKTLQTQDAMSGGVKIKIPAVQAKDGYLIQRDGTSAKDKTAQMVNVRLDDGTVTKGLYEAVYRGPDGKFVYVVMIPKDAPKEDDNFVFSVEAGNATRHIIVDDDETNYNSVTGLTGLTPDDVFRQKDSTTNKKKTTTKNTPTEPAEPEVGILDE